MEDKFKIIDNSGDRKYFTIIPNYVVNHSTAYEQSLYLVMKRMAGETGTCWASASTLGKTMAISSNTVKKYRKKIEERGWIKRVGSHKVGKTQQVVNEYSIVNLWELNVNYYKDKEKVSTGDTLQEKEVESRQPLTGKVSTGETKVSTVDGKEEPVEEDISKEDTTTLSEPSSEGVTINFFIAKFSAINPSYKELFKRKNQRSSMGRLLKEHGEEKIERVIFVLLKTNKMKYAPVILTPMQLEDKLGALVLFIEKEKAKGIQTL